MNNVWEAAVAINPTSDDYDDAIFPASHYSGESLQRRLQIPIKENLKRDTYPLPCTSAREGYFGDKHLNYWVSGLLDSSRLVKIYMSACGKPPSAYLDFGGASGRVARHMLLQHDVEDVWIADLNRKHINFCTDVFKGRIKAFQSTSIPHLPLNDNSFDLISAFSVFSHIETFDDTWLLELRRLLKPDGLIILTANVDTFQDVTEEWPVYKALINHRDFDKTRLGRPLEQDRLIIRWDKQASYSSVVFLTRDYVERRWKPFFSSFEILPYLTQFQSGVVLKK